MRREGWLDQPQLCEWSEGDTDIAIECVGYYCVCLVGLRGWLVVLCVEGRVLGGLGLLCVELVDAKTLEHGLGV